MRSIDSFFRLIGRGSVTTSAVPRIDQRQFIGQEAPATERKSAHRVLLPDPDGAGRSSALARLARALPAWTDQELVAMMEMHQFSPHLEHGKALISRERRKARRAVQAEHDLRRRSTGAGFGAVRR
jgi:hypothetical protein